MCLRRKFRCLVPATAIALCSKARRLCSKCLSTPRIKLLGTSEASERSAIYQERGGGKGKGRRGKGEELEWNGLASHPKGIEVLLIASGNGCRDSTFQICESATLQIFFLFFFFFCFLYSYFGTGICQKMAVAQEHISVGLHFMLFILWIVAGCGTARHRQDRCRCADYLQPLSQFSRTANTACDPF